MFNVPPKARSLSVFFQMRILQKSIHEHFLYFHEFVDQSIGYSCAKCCQAFYGSAFSCEDCKFWLHSKCVPFPGEIDGHPLHSKHPLKLQCASVLCNKCSYFFDEVPRYACDECSVSFDFGCIFPINDDEHAVESGSLATIETERENIRHFCHQEKLYLCKGRKLIKKNCRWCNLVIDDDHMTYSCLFCRFILHESCLDLIPNTVQHPFHPWHPLRMKYHLGSNTKCDACKNVISNYCIPRCFACEDCNFFLHIGCANFLKPKLTHHCHEHKLTYFQKKDHEDHNLTYFRRKLYDEKFFCKSCGVDCALRSTNGFYRCVDCDINFHLECAPIPRTAKHEYHIHSLTLMDSFLEDDFEEYYCDICEEKRDATHHVYCCEECKYVAHIECVLNEKQASPEHDNVPKVKSMKPDLKERDRKIDYEVLAKEATRQKEAGVSAAAEFPSLAELDEAVSDINQIRHFSHNRHLMRLTELDDKEETNRYCDCCREKLCGSVYTCESCQFHLHKNCAELPQEIQHPFHPRHSFTLFTTPPFGSQYFICNACGYLSSGFYYYCEHCWLSLDMKCARIQDEGQKVKKWERKTIDFKHDHEMELGNSVEAHALGCGRCQLPISGPVYCCLSCNYFIHESCSTLPFTIQHPCHPQHPLLAENTHEARCYGCNLAMDGIRYFCGECDLSLHLICADSLTRALKHKSHKHKLYYFGPDILRFFQNYGSSSNGRRQVFCYACNLCGKTCDRPFYRCVKCRINLHLECMQIPTVAEGKFHIHPLTLMDSFREDDFGKYYCDACETERNPDHHVYCCEDCNFFAHVECMLCEEEVGDPEKESYADEASDVEEESGKEEENDDDEEEESDAREEK